MVTVDLEHAVIPPPKDEARARSMLLFDGPRTDGVKRVVRVNGMRTPFGLKDLLAIVEHPSPADAKYVAQGGVLGRGADGRCVAAALGAAGGQQMTCAVPAPAHRGFAQAGRTAI